MADAHRHPTEQVQSCFHAGWEFNVQLFLKQTICLVDIDLVYSISR